jgi:hypothetical protein
LALAAAPAARGSETTFFGYDAGLGEGTALLVHPNSDAARANFFSNLTGVGTENLESFSNLNSAPLTVNFGSDTATLNGSGNIVTQTHGTTNGAGRYAISGNNYWEATQDFSITFSTAQAAFGFYATDLGDFNGQLTLTLLHGGTEVVNVGNPTGVSGGSAVYFGIIETSPADQFTKVTFGNTAAGTDIFGFDDFSIGRLEQVTPVPLPSSAAAGIVLIGVLAGAHGRRRLLRSRV